MYRYNFMYTHKYLCFNANNISEKPECSSLITWFCPETKYYSFHWMYMGGTKKPKATDQSLLTYRKEHAPNITQILPLSVPPVKIILALEVKISLS